MTRLYVATDVELNTFARADVPVIRRDAWCIRRHEELADAGALPAIPAEALDALTRLHNRYTSTGDLRG